MILVTGGNGFVGTRLSKRWEKRADVVYVVRTKTSIQHERKEVVADLTRTKELEDSLHEHRKIDTIVHLASITDNNARSDKDFNKNQLMARNLIKIGEKKGVKKIIFISSNATRYSGRKYATTKMLTEEIIKEGKIPYTIVRPTLIVGKGSLDVEKIKSIADKLPFVPIPGANAGVSNPIHVEDVINFIDKCLDEPDKSKNKTYSIGGPEKITTQELVSMIARKTVISLPKWITILMNKEMAKMLTTNISVDIKEAQNEMKWTPRKVTTKLIFS